MHLVYEGLRVAGVYYLERLPSGHWNQATLLDPSDVSEVGLAVGPDDALHFVWHVWGNNQTTYQVRQANGQWDEPEMLFISYEAVYNLRGLSILVDQNNIVHVTGSGQYITRTLGSAWSEKEEFASYAGYMEASMASDRQGNLYLLYGNDDNHTREYRVRRNGIWSQPLQLSNPYIQDYELALDGEGRAHVTEEWVFVMNSRGIQYRTNLAPAEKKDYWIQQQIHVPEVLHKPTLSFWYSLSYGTKGQESSLAVQVQGEDAPVEVFSTTAETDWKHAWVDLSSWAGQTVTVTLTLQQAEGEIYRHVYLDDITLGSWLTPVVSAVYPSRFNWDWTSQKMTITGENLLPGAAVHIADLPVQDVEWIDESTLRIKLPAGLKTGRHDLWVTNPDGQMGAVPDAIQLSSILYLPFAPDQMAAP